MATTQEKLPPDCYISQQGTDLHFCSPINHASVFALTRALRSLEKSILDETKAAKDALVPDKFKLVDLECAPKPIMLHLTTYGGNVHAAFGAVDAILLCKVPVYTCIVGHVASAGTLISIVGKKRFMCPNATALIHEIRSSSSGKYSELRDDFDNATKTMERLKQLYTKHTTLTEEFLADSLRRDIEWDADQCRQHGIVDEVLGG